MGGINGYRPNVQSQKLHRQRTEPHRLREDAELDRQMILYWLKNYPGYREKLRQRVSEAAKIAETRSNRIDKGHANIDYIGREVEGCG